MPTDEDSSAAWAQALTLEDPRLFHNRELSLLSFQERVLGEAKESSNPLLERLNFLSIFGSNIDEFFQVRVAVLKQRAASGVEERKRVDGFSDESCWTRFTSRLGGSGRLRMRVCATPSSRRWQRRASASWTTRSWVRRLATRSTIIFNVPCSRC